MYMNVKPTSVTIFGGVEEGAANSSISFSVVPGEDHIELSSGEVFSRRAPKDNPKLEARLVVSERAEIADKPVGTLDYLRAYESNYREEPSEIIFEVSLPTNAFNRLWDLATRGIIPSSFGFKFEGMAYGTSMHGNEKLWNVEEAPRLTLNSVNWSLTTVSDPPEL